MQIKALRIDKEREKDVHDVAIVKKRQQEKTYVDHVMLLLSW